MSDSHRRSEVAALASQLDAIFKGLSGKSELNHSIHETAILLRKAAVQGSRYAADQLIMKQLHFDAMDHRRDMIVTAHNSTLTWMFGTRGQAGPTSFNDWLISDKRLYWISGKPGSGKSTLMVRPQFRHIFKCVPKVSFDVLHMPSRYSSRGC